MNKSLNSVKNCSRKKKWNLKFDDCKKQKGIEDF